MQAPDFHTLFDFQGAVERSLRSTFAAVSVDDSPIVSLIQRSGQDIPGENIAIQFVLGQWTGSYGLDNERKMQRRAWAYTLRLIVATPEFESDRARHGQILAQLRYIMTLGATFDETAMPYHVLSTVRDFSGTEGVVTEDDENNSILTFGGIVCIRNNAWPAGPAQGSGGTLPFGDPDSPPQYLAVIVVSNVNGALLVRNGAPTGNIFQSVAYANDHADGFFSVNIEDDGTCVATLNPSNDGLRRTLAVTWFDGSSLVSGSVVETAP
jgi:hypothetical protein